MQQNPYDTLNEDERKAVGSCQLFTGVNPGDMAELFICLGTTIATHQKGSYVYQPGEAIDSVGVLISGSIMISHEDYWGRRSIIAKIDPSGIFGESFACSGEQLLPISAQAAKESKVMLINCRKLLMICPSACPRHSVLINNLASVLAQKNVALTHKMHILSKRSIRERVLAFLSQLAGAYGTGDFALPFSRGELADYLCVDRSAMTRELAKMKSDGLLDYKLHRFILHKKDIDIV